MRELAVYMAIYSCCDVHLPALRVSVVASSEMREKLIAANGSQLRSNVSI